jgi:hypothetical protein
VIWAVVLLGGFLVGFAIARWWTLIAALAFGIYITAVTDVDEVPHVVLGLMYAAFAAIGIAVGVAARRGRTRRTGIDR